jgi:NDP-sugar pyrophosphorylase family protein
MRAVILAGGLGTRLRPLTFSIPKPLLPVGEHPILELILKRLIEFGFEEFIFSVGYRAEFIEAYFGDGTRFGTRIHYLREEEPTGTAGALSLLQENFDISDDETFLLMNGDILTDLDFNRFIDHHKREGFDLTVGVKEIERQLPGVYLVQGDVLPLVPTDTYFTIPDLVERLVAEGRRVGSYTIEEFWIGVEHQEELDEARHRIGVEPE